jgi:spore maturation protein A
MLNYIWLALIVCGILVAVGRDVNDLSTNRYHNGEQYSCAITLKDSSASSIQPGKSYPSMLVVTTVDESFLEQADLIPSDAASGVVHIFTNNRVPDGWKEIATAQNNGGILTGHAHWKNSGRSLAATVRFDPVKFVNMNVVTNEGVINSAKTAVELAIGLIGIMALWLGIMKIAEQAGLIAALGRLLKPITTRIFPDVPADHPAMGAMIMNISANMLGLSNAATPFGLKAMEELNKLNPKLGTATDSMCTFLVINTGNVQLIPATVIAIRAAAGSSNPAEILGTVIVVTFLTMIVGITSAKLLAKLPVYRRSKP